MAGGPLTVLSRPLRNWAQLGLQVVLLLAGLGLLQLVAERTNRRFDLTPTRQLSLSPVTRNVLAEVTGDLRMTVFYHRGERERHAQLLERFRAANRRIDFELLDLDRYPERARALGVTRYGRVAIEYQGRRVVATATEDELAGGVLRALRGRPRRMGFTTGHGERSPGGESENYGRLTSALATENYAPEAMSLLGGEVADGTEILIVAGPRHDLLPRELDALARYLEGGGGVLLLLDPAPLPNLRDWLGRMGIALRDDMVIDRERRLLGTEGLAAVVELFKRGNPVSDAEDNPIESGVVLPSARTIDVATDVPGVRAESIARTSSSAWAMADAGRARAGAEPSRAKDDTPGPLSVVVMAEVHAEGNGDAGRPGRLVVIGDADFASDAYLDLLGNRDLALNAVAWVAGEEALSGGRTKSIPEITRPLSPLVLTAPQARTIFLSAVVVEPALVLLVGAAVVGLRRRRG